MELQLTYVIGDDGIRRLTLPDETRAWVVDYIRTNAALPADGIAAIVRQGHDDLRAAIGGVTEEQARFKPGPDDWSILEILNHLVTVKRIIANLGQHMAQGQLPPGLTPEWQEESAQDGVTLARFDTLAEASAAADEAHAGLLAFIDTITPATSTEAEFRHFLFGSMNCRQWAVFQRIHEMDHAPAIARVKESPGYPA